MRYLLVILLSFLSPVLLADNTANYRSAFIDNCTEGDRDPTNNKMCACIYDTWQQRIDSTSAKGAIIAAKVSTQSSQEFYPSELQTAAPYLQKFGEVSTECADKVIGKISVYNNDSNDAGDYDYEADQPDYSYPEASTTKSKKGLLGAVAVWAGNKVGLPSDINDAVKDKADSYEPKLSEKLNPLKSKFNPFKKNKNKEADKFNNVDITDRPVASYKNDFYTYCGQLASNVCDCRWQTLNNVLGGKDDAEARVLAYMASGPAGDLPIPADVSINRQQLFQKHSEYSQQIDRCQ